MPSSVTQKWTELGQKEGGRALAQAVEPLAIADMSHKEWMKDVRCPYF
jgi:hypothetical protein